MLRHRDRVGAVISRDGDVVEGRARGALDVDRTGVTGRTDQQRAADDNRAILQRQRRGAGLADLNDGAGRDRVDGDVIEGRTGVAFDVERAGRVSGEVTEQDLTAGDRRAAFENQL